MCESGGVREREGNTLELGLLKCRGASLVGAVKRVGVPSLSLDLGLGLIYIKLHKNFMECSGTFHLFHAVLLYSTGFYSTILGHFPNPSINFYNVPSVSRTFHHLLPGSIGFRGIPEHSMGFRSFF